VLRLLLLPSLMLTPSLPVTQDGWNYGRAGAGQPQGGCDMICFQTFPGCDTAVSFYWTGEDSGPNVGKAGVLKLYAQARARFPGAVVRAGGLDDVATALLKNKDALPVLTGEIGDTWSCERRFCCSFCSSLASPAASDSPFGSTSDGIQSDPVKTRDMRLLMRHRSNYSEAHRGIGAVDGASAQMAMQPTQPISW